MTSASCEKVLFIRESKYLKTVYGCKLIFCLISLYAISVLMWKRKFLWLGNRNCRFLFFSHVFWSAAVSVTLIPTLIYEIIRLNKNYANPCDYLVPVTTTLLIRTPYTLTLEMQAVTMLSLCIERTVSTFFPNAYEKISNSKLAIVLTTLSIIFSILFIFFLLLLGIDLNGRVAIVSIRFDENEDRIPTFTMTNLGIEIICLTLFVITFLKTLSDAKAIRSKNVRLGNKYQINENKMVLDRMLPVCGIHFIMNIISNFGLSLFPEIFPNGDVGTYASFLETLNQAHMYAIFMPCVIIYQDRKKTKQVVNSTQEQDEYFKGLQQHFDKHPRK